MISRAQLALYMRAGCSEDKAEATKARTLGKVHILYAAGYRRRNKKLFCKPLKYANETKTVLSFFKSCFIDHAE